MNRKPTQPERTPPIAPAYSIEFLHDGRTALVTLDNPDQSNALGEQDLVSLQRETEELDRDQRIRVIAIRGAGTKTFSGGYDLADLLSRGRPAITDNAFPAFSKRLAASPKLTVALINGSVAGAAVHLCMACDIRFAVSEAHFSLPAARLGIVYDPVSIKALAREMGSGMARRLLLANERLSAQVLADAGVLSLVESHAALRDELDRIANRIPGLAPLSIAATKTLLVAPEGVSQSVRALQLDVADSADHAEAIAAIREKRKPKFNGN